MENINFEDVINEINNLFDNPRIVFWYDKEKKYYEDIKNYKPNDEHNFIVLIANNNEFYLKYLIEVVNINDYILIYFPYQKPINEANWLLDIELYSTIYDTNEINLICKKFNHYSDEFKMIIKDHIKFFDSEIRNSKLKKAIDFSKEINTKNVLTNMVAISVEAKVNHFFGIIKHLILSYYDFQTNPYFNNLNKYNLTEYFWSLIKDNLNYIDSNDFETFIKQLMISVIIKHFSSISFTSFFNQFDLNANHNVINHFNNLLDELKNESEYEVFQNQINNVLKINELVNELDISLINEIDYFLEFDIYLIKTILDKLITNSLDYDYFLKIINKRKNTKWYFKLKNIYSFITYYMQLMKLIDINLKELEASSYLNSPETYLDLYVEKWYEIDLNYHLFTYHFKLANKEIDLINQIIKDNNLLTNLQNNANNYYFNYLSTVNNKFSHALKAKQTWNFNKHKLISEFYNHVSAINGEKVVIIISDAFRYELGKQLTDKLKVNQNLKANINLDHLITLLPSITKVNNAALLPSNETLTYDSKSKTVKIFDYNIDNIENKNIYFKTLADSHSFKAINYYDIVNKNQNEIREYIKNNDIKVLYIFHKTIDEIGHKDHHQVFETCQKTIEDLIYLITKIHNANGTKDFVISSDHGFLWFDKTLDDTYKETNINTANPIESARRYLIVDQVKEKDDTIKFNLDYLKESNLSVLTPIGINMFKTSGSINYAHGGSSLSEIITPLITITLTKKKSDDSTFGPVKIKVNENNKIITQRTINIEFKQIELVANQKIKGEYITYFVDINNNKISNEVHFVADATKNDHACFFKKTFNIYNNIELESNKSFYLIIKLKNQKPNEYVDKIEYKVNALNFKGFE